jgi:IclR family KDG regulon transcriptional repressor
VLAQRLVAFTPHSLINRTAIETRLELIRERFFEDASDEVRLGINALCAPVFRGPDECVGIIGIVGTSAEIPSPPPQALIRTLHRVAGLLSAELNCRIYFDRGLTGR